MTTYHSPQASASSSDTFNDHAQGTSPEHREGGIPAEHPVLAALRASGGGGGAVAVKGYSGGLIEDSLRLYRSLDVDVYLDVPTHAILHMGGAESDGRVQVHVRDSARITCSLITDVQTMVPRMQARSVADDLVTRPLAPKPLGRRKLGFFESYNACLETACNEVGGLWQDGVGCNHRDGVDTATAVATELAYLVEIQKCNPVWRGLGGLVDKIFG